MNKLELKNLAPYLPYGLTGWIIEKNNDCFIVGASEDYVITDSFFDELDYTEIKPILRPFHDIEDYFKELWSKKDKEVREFLDADFLHSFDYLEVEYIHRTNINYLPVGLYNLLLKHHFDVFDLIPKDLAIDINTIKPNKDE